MAHPEQVWRWVCDRCGEEELQPDDWGDAPYVPEGWVEDFDAAEQEQAEYGLICDDCVRELACPS